MPPSPWSFPLLRGSLYFCKPGGVLCLLKPSHGQGVPTLTQRGHLPKAGALWDQHHLAWLASIV